MASTKASPKKTSSKSVALSNATDTKKTTKSKTTVTPKKATEKVAKDTVVKPKKPSKKEPMSGFERYKMIEVAAYYLAEKSGFAGNAADYWILAEQEIDKKGAKK